jgi:predicted metal-binding membrane protein
MAFCSRCGASLKTETAQPSSTPVNYSLRRNEKQEKQHNEKGEKHEKGQPSFAGLLIAGICLVILGAVAYTDSVYHWVPSGPEAGALGLLVFGVIVLIAGVYFWTRAKRRFPVAV